MEKIKDNNEINSKFIKCSRCKYKVKSRHKNNRGTCKDICSHCINEYLYRRRSKSRIDKRKTEYVKVKSSTKCNKESVKTVLSKLVELVENNMILLKAFNLSKYIPYKSLLSSREKCFHKSKIDIMFKEPAEKLEALNVKLEQIKENQQKTRYINVEPLTNIQYEHIQSLSVISPKPSVESSDKLFIPLQFQQKIINIDRKNVHLDHPREVKENRAIDCICKDKLIKCLTGSIQSISEDLSSKDMKDKNTDSISTVQMYDSAKFLNRSISELTERTFDDNFSYFFPKQDCVKSVMRTYKSSSEIIKEVMEMLSARTELDKNTIDLKLKKDTGDHFKRNINKNKSKDAVQVKSHRKATKTPENSSAQTKSTKPKGIKSNISKIAPKQEYPKTDKLDTLKEPIKQKPLSSEKKKTIEKPDVENIKSDGLHEKKLKEIKDWVPPIAPVMFPQNKLESSKKNLPNKKQDEKRKSQDITAMKLLNISNIQIIIPDNILLQLMKRKQAERGRFKPRLKSLSELKVSPKLLKRHRRHKFVRSFYGLHCTVCDDSEMDLDIDNILYNTNKKPNLNKMIIGTKIFKNVRPLKSPVLGNEFNSMLFQTTFEPKKLEDSKKKEFKISDIPKKMIQQDDKGVLRYALSDRSFIEKGWTMLPTEKIVRRLNVYRMKPAHPEFDWFKHNKNKKIMQYDTGEKLAQLYDDGKGCWFYKNGRKALDYYDAEEVNAQQRYVIYSNGEPDNRGRSQPLTILAMFDYLGNGIVFDHGGKIRLKYNQTEGVLLDRSIGPVSHWKWHTLNEPPVLQQIMIDTHMPHKDPDILKFSDDAKPKQANEEMIEIELENLMREKRKKLSQQFKPFQIKMKALKINENFSLKILGQSTIYLIFREGSTHIKLNIGMILDHKEIVDTDTAELGVVSNSLENFPAHSTSLERLQKSVAYAQRVERARVERDRRIHATLSCASVDKLTAGTSKPLRQAFRTVASDATVTADCYCAPKNSFSKTIYYDTRLI